MRQRDMMKIIVKKLNLIVVLYVLLLATMFTGCATKKNEKINKNINIEETVIDIIPIEPPKIKKLDASHIKNKILDIEYNTESQSQKLDLYYPNSFDIDNDKNLLPVIVAIHGGGFKSGDKESAEMITMVNAVEHGYAVASINYRLSDEATFPAAVLDAKAAVRYLRAHAEELYLDPNKIAAWGASAGGNLAAMLGTTGDDNSFDMLALQNKKLAQNVALASSKVQAVVDWFGPIDFYKMDIHMEAQIQAKIESAKKTTKQTSGQTNQQVAIKELPANPVDLVKTNDANSPESMYLGAAVGQNIALVNKANPALYITEADPPFLIQHGDVDPLIALQQSIDFSLALEKDLGTKKVTIDIMKGAGHGGEKFEEAKNIQRIIKFLNYFLEVK